MEVNSEGAQVRNRFGKREGEGKWQEVVGREGTSEFKILGMRRSQQFDLLLIVIRVEKATELKPNFWVTHLCTYGLGW